MIPGELVDRHLKLFPPEAWVIESLRQGMQGVGVPGVHRPPYWQWQRTLDSLLESWKKERSR